MDRGRTDSTPRRSNQSKTLHNDYVNYLGPHSHPFGAAAHLFSEELERKGYAACKLAGGVRASTRAQAEAVWTDDAPESRAMTSTGGSGARWRNLTCLSNFSHEREY